MSVSLLASRFYFLFKVRILKIESGGSSVFSPECFSFFCFPGEDRGKSSHQSTLLTTWRTRVEQGELCKLLWVSLSISFLDELWVEFTWIIFHSFSNQWKKRWKSYISSVYSVNLNNQCCAGFWLAVYWSSLIRDDDWLWFGFLGLKNEVVQNWQGWFGL